MFTVDYVVEDERILLVFVNIAILIFVLLFCSTAENNYTRKITPV